MGVADPVATEAGLQVVMVVNSRVATAAPEDLEDQAAMDSNQVAMVGLADLADRVDTLGNSREAMEGSRAAVIPHRARDNKAMALHHRDGTSDMQQARVSAASTLIYSTQI